MLIPGGSLGCGLPHRDLSVTTQHRILQVAAKSNNQCLVAAKALASHPAVTRIMGTGRVDVVNLAFDRHEIILAEGLAVESFYPDPQGLKSLMLTDLHKCRALYPKPPRKARHFAKASLWAAKLMANPNRFQAQGITPGKTAAGNGGAGARLHAH